MHIPTKANEYARPDSIRMRRFILYPNFMFSSSSQDLPQSRLLLCRQTRRELNTHTNHEVPPLRRLFRPRHALIRKLLSPRRCCRASGTNLELFPIDRLHSSIPARERFFEIDVAYVGYVVACAGEEGVWFL